MLGARGKVGAEVVKAVEAAPDLAFTVGVDQGDPVTALRESGTQVVVDFTHPDVVMDNLRHCVENGIHAVVGTTGFDDERLEILRGWLADSPGTGILIAPNFSIGALLMMRFSAIAAPFFESVEVVELHLACRIDARSGPKPRLVAQERDGEVRVDALDIADPRAAVAVEAARHVERDDPVGVLVDPAHAIEKCTLERTRQAGA